MLRFSIFIASAAILLTSLCAISPTNSTQPSAPQPHAAQADGGCFLAISDIHLNSKKKMANAYTLSADAGYDLWQAALREMDQLITAHSPSFILVLGDLPRHKADSLEANTELNTVIADLRLLSERDGIPLIYAAGNNDIPGSHNGVFAASQYLPANPACSKCWLMADGKVSEGLPATDASDAGYYSIHPLPDKKYRVIVLNTVPYIDGIEPYATQLGWLSAQLASAHAAGEQVLITMHAPAGRTYVGSMDWAANPGAGGLSAQRAFLNTIAPYRDDITAILSGHSHIAGIKVYSDSLGHYIAPGLSIPGIAPGHANYPAMEIVQYDGNMALTDFRAYYHRYEPDSVSRTDSITDWGTASFSFDSDVVNGLIPQAAHGSIRRLTDSLYTHQPEALDMLQNKIYKLSREQKRTKDPNTTVFVNYK